MIRERIEKIIRDEGLTPSKFADEIGVQRSSISHIISGRNKPSLELVQKILSRFRNINAEWLVDGRGDAFKSNPGQQSIIKENVTAVAENMPVEDEDRPEYGTTTDNYELKEDFVHPGKVEKSIEKIVIFFNDKTYQEYFPD
ncbi:MAG: helix-turn-helix transcriptional regulator [Bacteroidota bacterium]